MAREDAIEEVKTADRRKSRASRRPDGGNQPNSTAKVQIIIRPSQKIGIETPASDSNMKPLSSTE